MAYDVSGQIKGNIVTNSIQLFIAGKVDSLEAGAQMALTHHAYVESLDVMAEIEKRKPKPKPLSSKEHISNIEQTGNIAELDKYVTKHRDSIKGMAEASRKKITEAYSTKLDQLNQSL